MTLKLYAISLMLIVCLSGHATRIEHQTTYSMAGVDIDAGDNLVDRIAPLARATARPGTDAMLGGFSSVFDLARTHYKDPLIVSTTDGVGTKLKLATMLHKHDTIGIDLVAMCVNDLIVHGAEPVMFLDYFATSKLDVDQAARVIKGIAQGCKQAGCSLTGGETAEMPGMYAPKEYDLAGFAIGIVERSLVLPRLKDIHPHDVVLGLASSGIHSNGYSLVRYLIDKYQINLFDKPPFPSEHSCLGAALLTPTIIYVKSLLPLIQEQRIKALAHITGGGLLENIPRVLPHHCAVELDMQCWSIPPVFTWLAELGNIAPEEMVRTFNMGIGMVAIVDAEQVNEVMHQLEQSGQTTYVIGKVIELPESKNQVVIQNI